MIKKALLTLVAAFALAAVPLSSAAAWTATLSGYGKCQPDGSFLITWKLNNHEQDKFTVTGSSDELVVPTGTKVDGKSTSNFSQTVDGTKPGTFNLNLTGGWTNSEEVAHPKASVYLKYACKQPATITVNKQTNPADDKTVFNVTVSPVEEAGGQVYGSATQSIVGGGSVVFKVAPGTYNVTEATTSGWTQTSNTCTNLVVAKSNEDHDQTLTNNVDGYNRDHSVTPPVNLDCTIVNTKEPGQVLSTSTQVAAPVKGVSAGLGGGSTSNNVTAVLGLSSSIVLLGLGLRRLYSQS